MSWRLSTTVLSAVYNRPEWGGGGGLGATKMLTYQMPLPPYYISAEEIPTTALPE